MHDLIIIGGGPAGMTAAIYGARKVLDQVMISPDIGGQATWAGNIENYLGYWLISGYDLVSKFEEHVKEFGVNQINDKVKSLERHGDTFLTRTEGGQEYESRTVIVAAGRSSRTLGVPGESEYKGKGVAYCATCDAPLFAGEEVAVVGGGNSGLDAAIQLSKIAKKVSMIESAASLTGDPSLQRRVNSAPNVQVLSNTQIKKLFGNTMLTGISTRNLVNGKESDIPVTGVFVEIGSRPNLDFAPKDLALNDDGEIIIDCGNCTNIPGLFAAGDATTVPGKQIIIAAGEGAKALLSAYSYIIRKFADGA
jgi:alkyl hydroperoxide reductase subunit F